ncbi:MAG: hypothetical protein U0003_04420 [Vampirovibrionales bacterium]
MVSIFSSPFQTPLKRQVDPSSRWQHQGMRAQERALRQPFSGQNPRKTVLTTLGMGALLGMMAWWFRPQPQPKVLPPHAIVRSPEGLIQSGVHWQNAAVFDEAVQGLRQHAAWLWQQRSTLSDVKRLDSLATLAAQKASDDPETFLRLMNELFFIHLEPKHCQWAGIPPTRLKQGRDFVLGCQGLNVHYSEGDSTQLSRHFWFFVNAGFFSGVPKADLGLWWNEQFGSDPSPQDEALGKLAIQLGNRLRLREVVPSGIEWARLLQSAP